MNIAASSSSKVLPRRSTTILAGSVAGLLAAALFAGQSAKAATYSWVPTVSELWSTDVNWTPTAPTGGPSGVGDVDTINTDISATATVTLFNTGDPGAAQKTLGILNVGDANNTHSFTIAAGTGSGSLLFDNSGAGAQINELATSKGDTISAPIVLNDTLTIANASGNTFTLSGGITSTGAARNLTLQANGAGAITLSAGVVNNAGTITNSGSSGLVTISAVIGSNVTNITQNSAGSTLVISGVNNAAGGFGGTGATGTVTVTAGTLKSNQTAIGAANAVTVNGGTLDLTSAGNDISILSLSDGGVTAGSAVLNTSATVRNLFLKGAATTTFGGVISGKLTVYAQGTTSLTLTNANTNVGGVAVDSGATITTTNLQGLGDVPSTPTGKQNLFNSGTIRLLNDGTGSNGTIIFGSPSSPAGYSFQLGNNSFLTIGNNGANTGNTVQLGTINETTTGRGLTVNTSSGYKLSLAQITGSSAYNGTSPSTTTYTSAADLTIGGISNYQVTNTGPRSIRFSGVGNTTITGAVTGVESGGGKVGLAQNNAASTLTLNGAGTYSGGVTLTAGSLNIGHVTALGTGTFGSGALVIGGANTTFDNTSSGALTVANGLTVSNGNAAFTGTNNLTFNGAALITGGDRTITVTNAPATLTLAAGLGDSGQARSLTKAGAGTLALGGTSTYTGTTTVTAGTLLVSGLLTGSVTNVTAGTLGGTGTVGTVTVSSGAFLQGGDGASASGALTSGGDVTLGDNSIVKLTLGASATHSSLTRTGGTWAFDSNQAFTFNFGASAVTYDNIINGLTGSEAGLASIGTWLVTNPEYAGSTFSYDGAGGVDLMLVPEPGSAAALFSGLTMLLGLQRFRRRA